MSGSILKLSNMSGEKLTELTKAVEALREVYDDGVLGRGESLARQFYRDLAVAKTWNNALKVLEGSKPRPCPDPECADKRRTRLPTKDEEIRS